jgi:cytochrome c oxidase subunit 2
VQGEGNRDLGAPNIGGLDSFYVRRQLENFRQGRRGRNRADQRGAQMAAIGATLTDAATTGQVSSYIQTLSPTIELPTVTGNVVRGGALYSTCAPCHGERAEGKPDLGAPRLAGINDWYLVHQLDGFRSGFRGGRDDPPGATMKAIAVSLPDADSLRDVVAYITSLAPRPNSAQFKRATTQSLSATARGNPCCS